MAMAMAMLMAMFMATTMAMATEGEGHHTATFMVLLWDTFVDELVLRIAVDMRIISEIFGAPIITLDACRDFIGFRCGVNNAYLLG